MIVTALIFLGLLALLVLSHELGHFITAKIAGVKVLEFGIGFPPRLFSFKRAETLYSVNLLPLGGFVKLVGEEDPSLTGSLAGKSTAVRLGVLGAGSIMNILLPIVLIIFSLMIPHSILEEKVSVKEVAADSPAQAAGIESGDIILTINDQSVTNRGELSYIIRLKLGTDLTVRLEKSDLTQREVTLKPRWKPPPGQGAIGVIVNGVNSTTVTKSYPIWEAIPLSVRHCWEVLVIFRNEVTSWIIQGIAPQLTGPVGIAQMTGEVAKAGLSPLLEFAALISLNLAIVNLLPFPGLDGGRIIFVLIEWARRGRRISPKKENLVHLIGFIILMSLAFAVTYYDVIRIIQGESIVP